MPISVIIGFSKITIRRRHYKVKRFLQQFDFILKIILSCWHAILENEFFIVKMSIYKDLQAETNSQYNKHKIKNSQVSMLLVSV